MLCSINFWFRKAENVADSKRPLQGRIKNGILQICNVDILDGTPLLDIKPYVPDFDGHAEVHTGWLEQARKTVSKRKADNRFK
jgi:tRNA (Thr-GGU) A37 N-methylase